MVVQVIGIERKEGVFTTPDKKQIPYDNTYFYCVYAQEGVQGHKAVEYKIKTANLHDQIEVKDLVEVYYNQYRQPDMVVLVQKGDK